MTTLAEQVRTGLEALADPARAPAMQAYMKSAMPFLGVSTAPRRALCRELFKGLTYSSSAGWQADVLALWRGAQFREERYCAIDLAGIRQARQFQRIDALPLYEEMIVTGAWWDYVDAIAGGRLLALLSHEPEPMKRAMRDWASCDDMWKRRSAILCQLNARDRTDRALLKDCIVPSLASKEFFLRKGIGWALRQFARTDPDWVIAFVAKHGREISPLTRREALKHLPPQD